MNNLIVHKETHPFLTEHTGGKAGNLLKLEKLGVKIPSWVVVPSTVLTNQLDENNLQESLSKARIPKGLLGEIKKQFGKGYDSKTYAVRSSALDEDGNTHSFAGQFETFLHVAFDEIEDRILDVWQSIASERVTAYRKKNNLSERYGIAVIIQELIAADVAGVAFGRDPVSGSVDSKIVSSVYGLGEGLVSGELDADTFALTSNKVSEKLATKTHAIVPNEMDSGVLKVEVDKGKQSLPSLSVPQLKEIASLLSHLEDQLGSPQDIEFAYFNQELFLLQTRPITAIHNQGEYTLWDNSNIVESYPGITTPLTFSFILKMYERVYRQFIGLLGANESEIEQHAGIFANTLGLVRGRVYYNLLHWYKMLAMLPGYALNAEYMENMMGVKERFELKGEYQLAKDKAWIRLVFMVFKMIRLQLRLPKERKRFMKHLNGAMQRYRSIPFDSLPPQEIIRHYKEFEQTLLLKWKAPLINDFFAMIWFGILQKQTKSILPEVPNIHNDLLCGSQDIISVEPIHHSIEIASAIVSDEAAKKLFLSSTADDIWTQLKEGTFPEIKSKMDDFLSRFGERCVGELKLETVSYTQNPALFVQIIKSYVSQNITKKKAGSNLDEDLRNNAEKKMADALKGKPFKKWGFNYVLKKARDLVSNRENLRYERTRGFGMVRTMFSALGDQWFKEGHLSNPRDIFYLKLEEIELLEKEAFPEGLKSKIEQRKIEFSAYRKQPIPEERFFTYGNDFSDPFIYSKEKLEPISGDLSGMGCCPGRVKAKVQVVTDPNSIESLNGNILVTSSTDPGWVTLFPTASGIVVERGSLLSHSAIVSREMGIPCIVSVSGLLRTLKTGDEIEMDGSSGEIKILSHA